MEIRNCLKSPSLCFKVSSLNVSMIYSLAARKIVPEQDRIYLSECTGKRFKLFLTNLKSKLNSIIRPYELSIFTKLREYI